MTTPGGVLRQPCDFVRFGAVAAAYLCALLDHLEQHEGRLAHLARAGESGQRWFQTIAR
jgi:hypothetical protein